MAELANFTITLDGDGLAALHQVAEEMSRQTAILEAIDAKLARQIELLEGGMGEPQPEFVAPTPTCGDLVPVARAGTRCKLAPGHEGEHVG
jgi:hypothetical protein